ncbi:putative Serine/threonine-protein kinase mph1 [Paratrimastix pyriformis]|uniref:Serine/threonine-protein kinase mph1 n=1 Tax=Paratrimastix pyriformis TaxID=342808 RepID=A0ABQ8UEB5_9EUKA|nr:putative Serine/threonine-protein kinase mph1 [Paratrimastix pyriformis]
MACCPPPSWVRTRESFVETSGENSVNQYVWSTQLGSGSYGSVFRAVDTTTNKEHAIKICCRNTECLFQATVDAPQNVPATSGQLIDREVDILSKFCNDHIIHLDEEIRDRDPLGRGLHYLVFELADGGALGDPQELRAGGGLSPPELKTCVHDLIQGVACMHRNGVIHRDLKPSNLLRTSTGILKVADFDLAMEVKPGQLCNGSGNTTPVILAPEAIGGRPYCGFQADMWAVGCCIYQMIAGHLPFHSPGITYVQLLRDIGEKQIVIPDSIDPSLHELLTGLLERDPQRRLNYLQAQLHPDVKPPIAESTATASVAPTVRKRRFDWKRTFVLGNPELVEAAAPTPSPTSPSSPPEQGAAASITSARSNPASPVSMDLDHPLGDLPQPTPVVPPPAMVVAPTPAWLPPRPVQATPAQVMFPPTAASPLETAFSFPPATASAVPQVRPTSGGGTGPSHHVHPSRTYAPSSITTTTTTTTTGVSGKVALIPTTPGPTPTAGIRPRLTFRDFEPASVRRRGSGGEQQQQVPRLASPPPVLSSSNGNHNSPTGGLAADLVPLSRVKRAASLGSVDTAVPLVPQQPPTTPPGSSDRKSGGSSLTGGSSTITLSYLGALSPLSPAPVAMTQTQTQVADRWYHKLELIGSGGSGKVWRVLCWNDKRLYAMKKISQTAEVPSLEAYRNEIDLLVRLRGSKQIVTLVDWGPQPLTPECAHLYMVMELGECDFNKYLHQQRQKTSPSAPPPGPGDPTDRRPLLPMNSVRLYWQQMLEAVAVIHQHGIVHGDLKPANFLLVQGSLKLIDFGIAQRMQDGTTHIHRTDWAGTPNYMAPETLNHASTDSTFKMGRPADIWSLGCILYQIIYGRPPFDRHRYTSPHTPLVTPFAEDYLWPAPIIYGRPPFDRFANTILKINRIIDTTYEIEFPEPPEHNNFVLDVMRWCLVRDPKRRITMDALLSHPFLSTSVPRPDAAIITQQEMALLLTLARKPPQLAEEIVMRMRNGDPSFDLATFLAQAPTI